MNSRILPALALLISIGMFFAYVSPTWTGSIAATKAAIAADNRALAAAQKYSTQENELAASRSAIDPANLTRLSTLLPDSVDNVRLILDLNALAARSGLAITSIDVTTPAIKASDSAGLPENSGTLVNSVDLSLSANGSYAAVKTFLGGVEKSLRLLDVRELSINGSDTGVYTYHMKIRIHWLR